MNNINSNRKLHQVRSEHGNTQAIICAIHQETKFSSICYLIYWYPYENSTRFHKQTKFSLFDSMPKV